MGQDFYVYEHIRPDTGAVFYVGNGRGGRAKNFNARGKWWKNVKNKAGGVEVRYLVKNVDEELALFAEFEYIDVLRRRNVPIINICNGGEGSPGWVPSEETKQKISSANKGKAGLKGALHGMYGKTHSLESIAKMSKARKGVFAGVNHPMYGKHHTDEAKAKVSAAKKGTQVGVDNPFYGKTHTEEVRRRISEAQCGRKHSAETRAKQKAFALASAPLKQSVRPVFCVTNGQRYYGLGDAARQLGLHHRCIRMVCNGKLKQTGGYVFDWSQK
jgi:hypothetical protein